MSEKKQNYLGGAALLAATVAVTKIIGFIYKIPLYNLLGDEGTAHFNVTYTIYNLLLTISTAGIPVALSRLISSANATGRRLQVRRYFSVGLSTFGIIGAVCALIMFFCAQGLANLMGDYEVVDGVRVLAPAVLFACIVSVYRGYAQGFGNMVPTSISQIVEVVCKLIFGLTLAFFLSRQGRSSADISAGAIVGVTIGLGLAIPLLVMYKGKLDRSQSRPLSDPDVPMSRSGTMNQILKIGIPITLGSSIMNIITLIDTKFILMRLQSGAGLDYSTSKILYGVYSKGVALFNMPGAFITPVAVSLVPFIAAAMVKRQHEESRTLMESSLKLTCLVGMPAGVGLCVLSKPIFEVLYPNSNAAGPSLMAVLGIASFFVCTYIVTNAILQASGQEKLALLALPVGGVIKIAANWFLVGSPGIGISGAPVGTLLCYLIITALNVMFIHFTARKKPNIIRACLRPLLCSLIMGVGAWAVYELLYKVGSGILGTGRLATAVFLALAILVAVVIYFILIIVTRAVTKEDMKLIPKGEKIARLLKLR